MDVFRPASMGDFLLSTAGPVSGEVRFLEGAVESKQSDDSLFRMVIFLYFEVIHPDLLAKKPSLKP